MPTPLAFHDLHGGRPPWDTGAPQPALLALETGARKALERGLTARFLCHDALRLSDLGEQFDTALDSLLLHALDPAVRAGYLSEVRAVLRPGGRLHVLCYRDRHTGDPDLPHKMSRAELESCFTSGWDLESLQATSCATNLHPGGAAAWLATCRRT
jgi:SAM-dependent methyltransferase